MEKKLIRTRRDSDVHQMGSLSPYPLVTLTHSKLIGVKL